MTSNKRLVGGNKLGSSPSCRRGAIRLIGLSLLVPLAACGQGEKRLRKDTVLNVEMYSYLNRPIHDIIFNGTGLGVMNSYGGTGTITGVRIPFGDQTLKWTLGGPAGLVRNGEHMQMKNKIVISPEQIPPGTRYIGLHLYPDDTAEVTFAEFIPDRTARGEKILSAAPSVGESSRPKETVLNVVMYSYVDRVITNIIFNGTDLGVMNKFGSTGTITGVRIPFGIQTLTWTLGGPKGTPRNGDQMKVKNAITIFPEQIPPETRYIGLHLYPDDTAEVTFAAFIPAGTERGRKMRLSRDQI